MRKLLYKGIVKRIMWIIIAGALTALGYEPVKAIISNIVYSAHKPRRKVYLRGGTSSGPLVKSLPTIQPTETKRKVLVPELPPIIKKPKPSITPVENEGKVRPPEPPPEIIRPTDKKIKN